jgi:hypothetical protein
MRDHAHRAVPGEHRTVGWTGCVTGKPDCGAAHGAVVHVDRCRCGAKRYIETNGRHQASSGWLRKEG